MRGKDGEILALVRHEGTCIGSRMARRAKAVFVSAFIVERVALGAEERAEAAEEKNVDEFIEARSSFPLRVAYSSPLIA